jgi:SAM-dependent methyltransferase
MDLNFEKKYHPLEKSHWWFSKRRELAVEWTSDFPKDAAILDIGCSSGALLCELKERGFQQLYGIDVSENAVALAHEHGLQNTQVMDGANVTFESEKFDVVIASDCLEHIDDDQAALEHWLRILKPGGMLILFVPAYMFLWSAHDEINHHCRRYNSKQVVSIVQAAGFEIERKGFWNFFFFPGIALLRLAQRLLPKSNKPIDDLSQPPALINSVLSGIIHIENRLLRYINLPVGISTYVVAKKPIS